MVFITWKTLGVWHSNAHLLTVVFFPLVLIGDAFRSFRFCQQERGEILESILDSTWQRTADPRIRFAVATLRLKDMNACHICGFSHYHLYCKEYVCFQLCGIINFSRECYCSFFIDLILFVFFTGNS